jgi:PBP1b-binding outer membrane lipoprotein LpoB
MKKVIFLLIAVVLLAGCVSFPAEEQETAKADDIFEPVQQATPTVTETVQTTTTIAPNPLAPLPKQNTSNIAQRPKAITVNATNTTQTANNTKTVQKGWTTDSLSIEEGETKYVYIKQ